MKLTDAYKDDGIMFRDMFEGGMRIVHATKNGVTGIGCEPWPPPKDEQGHIIPRAQRPDSPHATQHAIDDLEHKLG